MSTSASPKLINSLDIDFRGDQADVGTLPFDGSTELCISATATTFVLLGITAESDSLVLRLISDHDVRKISLLWADPKPCIVSPCWKPSSDSNGYEIEFPAFAVTSCEFAWDHCGTKYCVHVSQQSGKPGWLKVRPEGPKYR